MNLLVVSACFPPAWSWGGPVRSIWNVCLGLRRAGAAVRVVTTDADLNGAIEVPARRRDAEIEIETCRVARWGGKVTARYGWAPGLIPTLWREIPRADLCVIQGPWTFPLALGSWICRRRRVPYVICPRGALEGLSLSEKAFKKRLYMRWVERRAILGAAALQFASGRERQNSREATAGRPSFVAENAVEAAPLAEPAPVQLRERLGIPAGQPLIGLSGRIHPRKGFEVIVPALASCESRPHLIAFGADEGDHRSRIEALARELAVADRVHFLGALAGAELQRVYASVRLLVVPSIGESFGNAALEALAQGTEALVSDRVPVGRYIGERGFGGVVDGLDPRSWAVEIDARLARRSPPDRARIAERVRVDFDVKSKGEELLERYAALISGAGDRR